MRTHEQLLRDIEERVTKIRSYTPTVGIFGDSGIGKSSLCNAIFGRKVAEVNDVEACTREPQWIPIKGRDGSPGLILVDVPGIGEDSARQAEYTALYKKLVPELDLVLWAIKSDGRNYDSSGRAFKEIFGGKSNPPVVIVITQIDKTNPIRDWSDEKYAPGDVQEGNILRKENDVGRRFDVSARRIISVAVENDNEREPTGRAYNLQKLVDLIVEVLPNEKKYSFTREAEEKIVSDAARQSAEKGILDSVREFVGEAWAEVKDVAVKVIIATAPKVVAKLTDWLKKWL